MQKYSHHTKMDCLTIYKTLSSKRHLFKFGLTDDPTCERCLEEDESATHVLCDCETITYLWFHQLGQFFMERSDYYDAPIRKSPAFHSKCAIIKEFIKQISDGRGAGSGCGPLLIHSFPPQLHNTELCSLRFSFSNILGFPSRYRDLICQQCPCYRKISTRIVRRRGFFRLSYTGLKFSLVVLIQSRRKYWKST
jgi:hypothetical protein